MKKGFMRGLSMLLAAVLTVSVFPMSIFAVGGEENGEQPSVQVYYDFAVQNTYSSQIAPGNMSVEDAANQAFMAGLYDAGRINWIYEGKHLGTVDKKGTGDIGPDFTENQYTASGIQTRKLGYNWWYAIRLKSPGEGTFDITVNTYTVTAGEVQKHAIWTEAYLLDAAEVDAGTTTIADSLTADNRLQNDFQPTADLPDVNLGAYAFRQDREYILVLRQTDATYQAGRAEGNPNLYLEGITMTKQVMVGQDVSYAFNLPDAFPGEIKTSGNTNMETQKDAIEALYTAESIDWSYVGYKPGTTKKDGTGDPVDRKYNKFDNSAVYPNGSGLYFKTGGGYNWWYALKLRTPGEGIYSITVNSTLCPEATTKAGAWLEAYLLDASVIPGAADDAAVQAAVDAAINTADASAVRLQDFKPATDALNVSLGTYNFGANTEYILVLRQNSAIVDAANAALGKGNYTNHIHLSGITMTELLDIPEETTTAPEETTVPGETTEATTPSVEEEPEAGYDFDLHSYYPGLTGKVEENSDYLDALYEAGKISWRFEAKKQGNTKPDNTGEDAGPFAKHDFVSGKGVQINGSGYNWYYAIRIKAPGTGTYDLTVNTYITVASGLNKHSVWTETYFFDAALLGSGNSLEKLLVKDNRISTFAPTTENPDAYVGNVATTAGREYILVLRQTKETYSAANVDGLRAANLYMKGLSFVEAAPPEPSKTGYDFDLLTNYPDDFSGGDMSVSDQLKEIGEFYKKGYIDWNFYGKGTVAADATGQFSRDALVKGTGIQVNTSGYDWYYAIRFRSPGKGYHRVTVDTFLPTFYPKDAEPFQRHSIWTESYILDAGLLDNGKITIADSMLKKNLLGEFAPAVDDPEAVLGYYAFEANKEYVLVLRQTKKSYTAGKEDGLTTLNLYLKGLTFTATPDYVPPKADNSRVVYDFDLADKNTGIYPNKSGLNDKLEDIHRLYGLEELNWEFAEPLADSYWSFTGNGVTAYTAADQYVAFRIKSPGEGLYTLSLSHGEFYKGALGAVYILPANTEDISAAMDTHNRVGMMPFYNDAGEMSDGVVDGIHSLVDTWEFGSADEYIVVVEAYGNSPYAAMSYMYISQLICEKGNTTSQYDNEKKIHSIVVDPAPVKINHSGTVNAVAEINGDDYFFMPQEGRSMSVYNMDTKELVAQVATPFTATRGIAVDEDGYVWLVGANPNIFRYDPYLDVGEWVYYYKHFENTPEDKSGIYEANNALGLVYAEGYLYFGVFGVDASFAKYNISTGEFTHMGVFGSEDANNYPTTPVYKDGILYGTIAGDANGDGKKTFEVVKIDAETNELLGRLDITKHVSQQEVMIRGMSICGDTLLLGGTTNDIKAALAIDVSGGEMKVIDIGVQGFINYYPTKEVDGKCYFLASGKGMWEFDGATKTAKPVKGLENATVGFRVAVDTVLTVENNDDFPNISFMGFRGSINMPTLYNMETGTMMTVDDMILDEHGNGQEIRSILKGKGENEIYLGAYRTNDCSVFDTESGKIVHAYAANSDQTDVMYIYKNNLYAGNYNAGVLTQINLEDERRNVPLLSLKSMYGQARIHTITGGDDYIFCGSVADSYNYSGCLAWINLENLSEKVVILDAVKEQSIISLCYNDGVIFAGSSIYGGTSTIERSDVSAKIAAYDVKTQKKLLEIDPRDYISGLPGQLTGIDAMIADPNIAENGKIWVVMGARLLCLKYNKDTNKVTLTEELCFDAADRGCHDFLPFMPYMEGHYLYVGFGAKGGLRKVNLLKPSDNVQIPVPGDKMFTLADDGNVYYASDVSLYMYPLNVTDADWAEADKVDQMIASIGTVTVDSEMKIREVRAAYEALSNKHKALIQNIYDLEAAEIDLVEAKIASIGEVTLEDKDLIETIKKEYTALSVKNRTYVKNYRDVYIPALQAYNALADAAEAARVQALIDGIPALGEITLEKEKAIQAIRAEYDALKKSQRALVDATLLLEAEATIKALRQVRIDRLIALIAGFGDPVTLADEPTITEAMEIYNWLYMDERQQVDYTKLVMAESALKKLQKAAAAEVDALILAIGETVSADSGDAIGAARKAYDALTPGSKAYVKNLAYLESAEALFAELDSPVMPIVIIAVAVVVVAGVAAILLIRRKKAKKANA